jgi:hypothetical protein
MTVFDGMPQGPVTVAVGFWVMKILSRQECLSAKIHH